jgi:hypothetical protein
VEQATLASWGGTKAVQCALAQILLTLKRVGVRSSRRSGAGGAGKIKSGGARVDEAPTGVIFYFIFGTQTKI